MLSLYSILLNVAISVYCVATVLFFLLFFILFLFGGVYLYIKVRNRRNLSSHDWLGLSFISGMFVILLLLKLFVTVIPTIFAVEMLSKEGAKAKINGQEINVSIVKSGFQNYIFKKVGLSLSLT